MTDQIQWFEKMFDKQGWTGVNGTVDQLFKQTDIAPRGVSTYILPVKPLVLQTIPDDHYILCPVYQWMERKWGRGTRMTGNDWQVGVTGTGYVSENFDGIAISKRELGEELGIIPNESFTFRMVKVNPTRQGDNPRIIFASTLDINNVTLNRTIETPLSGPENKHIKIFVLIHGTRSDIQERYMSEQIVQTNNTDGIKGVMAVPAFVLKAKYIVYPKLIQQVQLISQEEQTIVAQEVHDEAIRVQAQGSDRGSGRGSGKGSTTPRW